MNDSEREEIILTIKKKVLFSLWILKLFDL